MKLPTTPVNSPTRITGRLECAVSACGVSDPGGAAAARLLFRFTLDPLLGLPASNPTLCCIKPAWFLRRNR
jgi:hypothetical protein